MSTIIKNKDVRTIALGIKVSRAAAQLPQGATGNIFTVTGGRIKVLQLIGEFTVAADANATTALAQFLSSAAGASAAAWSIASGALASSIATTHLWLPAAVGSALGSDAGAPKASGGIVPIVALVCPPGAVQITTVGSNVDGRVKWDLYYTPLDVGAKVVAA